MKRILLALLLLAIPCLSTAKPLDKAGLLKVGAKQIECNIITVGTYNFIGISPDGKEINFNTDDSTIRFNPEDERLVVGDRVTVVYLEAFSPSKSSDKTYAILVEWLDKAPRDFLSGEVSCTITPLKFRSGRGCYVDSIKQVVRFEGNDLGTHYSPVEGDTIKINLKAVPASIGNGYVYKVSPATGSAATKIF